MDTSNNYINQNEELRNALLDLLFGRPVSIPNHNNFVTQLKRMKIFLII